MVHEEVSVLSNITLSNLQLDFALF